MVIKLHSVGLVDYSVYRNVNFVIPQGITIIRGRNASGKSLLGHVLPMMFWEHPVADKRDKSTGTLNVKFVSDAKYSISKSIGKSTKYKIIKNKNDMKVATIKEAENICNSAFPISPEYFWNCVYISSARRSPLQYSSPTERLVYLQNLFNLNIYEKIHTAIKDMLRTKKANKIQYDLIVREKDTIKKTTTKVDDSQLELLKVKNKSLQDKIAQVDRQITINKQYKSLEKLLELDFTIEESEALLTKIEKKLSKLKRQFNTYHRDNELYKKYLESLKYKDALDEDKLKQLSAVFDDRGLSQLKIDIKYCKEHRDVDTRYAGRADKYYEKLVEAKEKEKRVTKLDGKTVCPLCGSKISEMHMLKEFMHIKDDIPKYSKLYNKAKEADTYLKHRNRIDCSEATYKYLLDFIEEQLEISRNAKRYKDVVKVDKPVAVSEDEITKLEKNRDRLIKHISYLNQLSELPKKKVKEDIEKLRERHNNVFTMLTSLNVRKESYDDAKKRIRELNESLSQLDIEDLELLEVLLEAYSNKGGLKSRQIEAMLDTYVRKLNEFGSLLYSDKMVFSFKIDSNKCELYAERNGKIGSVSTFSGFETRGFQMISALALICILGIKVDTLFLDELENGMDEEHLMRFTTSFLPQLQRYIPKIVLITPRGPKELFVSDANEFKVIKKKGRSILCQK